MSRSSNAVHCTVDLIEIQNERGNMIPGVSVTCPKCGHATESFGTSERSIKRCLVMMREECPKGEKNYYVADEQSELEEMGARSTAPAAAVTNEPLPDNVYVDQDDIPF